MIKDLWDIAQGLLSLSGNFSKAKRERKDRIAEYFLKLGNILQEAADIFKDGDVPHGKCEQILNHVQYFSDVVGDTIDKDKVKEFQDKLIASHEVEMLASEILGASGTKGNIAELEKISGSFISLGDAIRATS